VAVDVGLPRPAHDPRSLALPIVLLAPVLGIAAVVSPAAAAIAVAVLLFVAVAFYDLAAGVALFTTFTFLEALPAAGGDVDAVKAGGFVLVLAALRRSSTPFLLKEQPKLAYVATFFAGWALASTLWAANVSQAAADGVRLLLGVALVFVVFAAVRQARDARWVVWGYLAGATAAALVGLVQPADNERLVGSLGEPNFLAAMLLPAFVFTVFATGWTTNVVQRWLLGLLGVLFLVSIFLTQSRGGLIALGVAIVAGVVLGGPRRRMFALFGGLAAAVGLAYYALFASDYALERLTNPGRGTGRADLWSVATGVIGDNPVVGVGAGNFPVVAPQYAAEPINLPDARLLVDTPKVAHNTYLGVFAELGVVGLALFALVVLGSLVLLWRAGGVFARRGDVQLELISRAVLVSLVGMLAAFVFLSGEYEKQLWLLLGLAVALHGLARRRGRTIGERPIEPLSSRR
jgi:O-antigen ligase